MKSLFQKNNSKRQKLVSFEKISSDEIELKMVSFEDNASQAIEQSITTIESLREHLQIALEIEHSTIPPYLCALYSIKEGSNEIASSIIRSVVVEEMLHMILVANILNAIGGEPKINSKSFIPKYPTFLPHSNKAFKVNLQKFSKDTMRTFLKIEKPSENLSLPQPHNFNSIGQFYKAIHIGIEYCEKNTIGGIFTGVPERQITSEHYYGSGGNLIGVYSIKDAFLALNEIVGQGEGIDGKIIDPDDILFGDDIEYAHYFRFNEILQERYYKSSDAPQDFPSGERLEVDWKAVYNMDKNPRMENYSRGTELWNKSLTFNRTYMSLLSNIHSACNGQPALLMKGVALMYELKYQALELMKIPIGNSELMAGPTFEYVEEDFQTT